MNGSLCVAVKTILFKESLITASATTKELQIATLKLPLRQTIKRGVQRKGHVATSQAER
jgi:hypothetical protein